MDKLPPVSYIRLVDIWLISVQLIPFILVILRTMLELYSDQGIINHHGNARKVGGFLDNNDSKSSFASKLARYLSLLGNFHLIMKNVSMSFCYREEGFPFYLSPICLVLLDIWNLCLHGLMIAQEQYYLDNKNAPRKSNYQNISLHH